MSVHKREEVLDRVSTILQNLDGFESHARNRGLLDNDQFPATILLDGDETDLTPGGGTTSGRGSGRVRMSPAVMKMHPQIFIILKTKRPGNLGIGPQLNEFRGVIIKALAADEQLVALIGPNGNLSYDGCETDLKTGSAMEGQMQLSFSISCVMNPYA